MMRIILAAGLLAAFGFAGCSRPGAIQAGPLSPLVGTWTGKSDVKGDVNEFLNSVAGGPLTGPCSLTLNRDGTGFLKVADLPEKPISWKQEDQKVILQVRTVESGSGSAPSDREELGSGPWVGTLSSDSRSLAIDMGKVKVLLEKS